MHLSRLEEALTKIALGYNFYEKYIVEGKGIDEWRSKEKLNH
jgi:hypothetical protein